MIVCCGVHAQAGDSLDQVVMEIASDDVLSQDPKRTSGILVPLINLTTVSVQLLSEVKLPRLCAKDVRSAFRASTALAVDMSLVMVRQLLAMDTALDVLDKCTKVHPLLWSSICSAVPALGSFFTCGIPKLVKTAAERSRLLVFSEIAQRKCKFTDCDPDPAKYVGLSEVRPLLS